MTKEELKQEAEEYARRNNPAEYGVRATHFTVLNSFKDGAEFGYNKANEWHYVKDGDLPKEEKEYLVYNIDGYGCKSIKVMQFNNQHCWCANCQNEIIAWKEIVLPKEVE